VEDCGDRGGGAAYETTGAFRPQSGAMEDNTMRIRWRGLELPTRVVRDDSVSTEKYGLFMVEPFERGFGTTVGNSLRRILLSSLEGAAVTHVKIKGAQHEFMSLPGVQEDVTGIILNIKQLILRLSADEPKTMRVAVKGKKNQTVEVRASDIEADPAITIINTDQVLATLTQEGDFEIEMTVGRGRSYATAEENKPAEQIIGIIPVDSVYSPVTRVRFRVEDTRVGQRTNYDRLVMEIWTNGTLTPEMALVEAAKILRKHLNPFVQYADLGSGLAARRGGGDGDVMHGGVVDDAKLAMPIDQLELSVRASNCLESAKISTVGELISWDESRLLQLRSFGKTSLREVKRKLADMGLTLAGGPGAGSDFDDDSDDGDPAAMPGSFAPATGSGLAIDLGAPSPEYLPSEPSKNHSSGAI